MNQITFDREIPIFTDLWLQNSFYGFFDIGFEYVRLGQLFVPMRGQPNAGQRALLGQHEMRVEHPESGLAKKINLIKQNQQQFF